MEVYDLNTLRRGLKTIESNIDEFKKALKREEEKREDYLKHIAQAEAILELHGQKGGCASGDHLDWVVEEWLDQSQGVWKRRKCRVCGTTERVGHHGGSE